MFSTSSKMPKRVCEAARMLRAVDTSLEAWEELAHALGLTRQCIDDVVVQAPSFVIRAQLNMVPLL